MFSVTRFCVQPYLMQGGRLVPGEPERFHSPELAIERAQHIERRFSGVAVYRVSGWPVQDLWGKPALIAQMGRLPSET
jgi:hypothetical protein